MNRTLVVASAALLGPAGLAAAQSGFSPEEVQDADMTIELGTVTAEADGVVEIYSWRASEVGDLLGTQAVAAGATADVAVRLTAAPPGDVLVVLRIGEEVAAQQEIELDHGGDGGGGGGGSDG